MAHSEPTFESLLRETLPWIDERFAKEGKPVQERPFAAAQIVVEFFIVEIKGDTKDNYLTKPWFAGIFDPILNWYERRYGQALLRSKQAKTIGLVHYFGSPLTFQLALVVSEPGEIGTTWVRFPKEVLENEDPLTWLDTPPPIEAMPAKRGNSLRASVATVANLLRGINNDLNTADLGKSAARSLVATILKHFEKAARDGASTDLSTVALGIWDLQMACEKAMKAFLFQSEIDYPDTHDLRALQKLAEVKGSLGSAKQFVAAMPSERRVVAWRYSELSPPTPADFFRFYLAALNLAGSYAAAMSRKHIFNNFAVQLRKPPW